MNKESFESYHFNPALMKGITEAGFKAPSHVQKETIPLILQGKDLIAQAETGSGKTAAFGLPFLQLMECKGKNEMLVLAPTRELAQQVSDELFKLGRFMGLKTATISGGASFQRQIESVRRGVDVVVATPGRLLDLLETGRVPALRPSFVVLDEADEMMSRGFLEEVEKIFGFLPEKRQTLLFSATMPKAIKSLADRFQKNPVLVSLVQKETSNRDIAQEYYVIKEQEREAALVRLIESYLPNKAIVFCNTKKEVDRLAYQLAGRGFLVKGLHGDMDQSSRQRVMGSFREGEFNLMVATDVAARGLDVADLTHVFNYQVPFESENYVHRIGRTGRAGKKGIALTLITPEECGFFRQICQKQGTMPELKTVPSRHDMRKALVKELVSKIMETEEAEEVGELVQHLGGDVNYQTLAGKLMACLLERKKVLGPDKMGWNEQDLAKVLQRPSSSRGGRPGGRGRPNRSFSRRR